MNSVNSESFILHRALPLLVTSQMLIELSVCNIGSERREVDWHAYLLFLNLEYFKKHKPFKTDLISKNSDLLVKICFSP